MINAYQTKAGITPNFPIILANKGATALMNLFSMPGYGGPTFIMHPDLEWVETKYSQPTLTSDMLKAIYDDCNDGGTVNYALSIASPDGGENFNFGEEVPVKWYTNVSGNVDVSLLKNGKFIEKLGTVSATVSGKQGAFNWTIPGDLNINGDFTITVTSNSTSAGDTSYKHFNILPYGKIEQSKISIADHSPYMSWNGIDYTPESSIDGDIETFWMNELILEQGMKGTLPAYVTYKLDKEYSIVGFSHLTRVTGTGVDIKGYKLEVSTDGAKWISASAGNFPEVQETQIVNFDQVDNVRYVRFKAVSAYNTDYRASCSEFNLFYGGTTTGVKPGGQNKNYSSLITIVPTNSSIRISLQQRDRATVKILSLSGRVIASYATDEYGVGTTSLKLPDHLSSGAYMVQFAGENGSSVEYLNIVK